MSQKDILPGSDLLPTVGEPGTYAWAEEVVEVMNAAWRAKETSEQGFLAAVRAATQYQIWELLSPPPPEEPLTSLDSLIRRFGEPGQAENMQIAIRFSGVLDEPATRQSTGVFAADEPAGLQVRAVIVGDDSEQERTSATPPWGEEAGGDRPPFDLAAIAAVLSAPVDTPDPAMEPAPRRSAAQRKRDRLERTHPELAEAVDAGEMTLKQAYVKSGIEKEVRTIDKLQKLWRTATEEEQNHFLSWLDHELQLQQKREYEQEVYGEDA